MPFRHVTAHIDQIARNVDVTYRKHADKGLLELKTSSSVALADWWLPS